MLSPRSFKIVLVTLTLLACIACPLGRSPNSVSISDPRHVLDRAYEIRREMRRAFSEDCMISAKIVTDHGIEEVQEWCAAIRPFGDPFYASDLILLFQARVSSNETRHRGPMFGDVEGVIYFGAGLLAQGRVREAIPVMTALLRDPVKVNREWVAFCLVKMAEMDPDLRKEIAKISFPKEAIGNQRLPSWIQVAP